MKASAGQIVEMIALARQGHLDAFIDRAWSIPAADLADVLTAFAESERDAMVLALPPRLVAPALTEMAREAGAERVLARIDPEHSARLIAQLEDDDATDLLRRLPLDARQRILEHVADASALHRLLVHESTSAGGLMTTRMVTVQELEPIGLAIETVRRQAAEIGDLTEIYVVDVARRLTGVLSVPQLLVASPATPVRDVMSRAVVHVGPGDDQEQVARVIGRYSLTSVPVVDPRGHLLGRVTADDVRDVPVDIAADDLLRFGGVSRDIVQGLGVRATVRSRLPSLYTNLFAAFAAAAVVYFFRGSLLRIISLAVWMPVVAGVGGNAGTQAIATSLQRLVLRPDDARGLRKLVLRELLAGTLNGVAIGSVVAVVAVLLGESWKFGLVVLGAMVGTLVIAGATGAAIPVVLRRIGRDPALGSPVFVTAIMDVCAFALLLALGTLLLR